MNNKKSPSRTTRFIEAAIALAVACFFVVLLVPGIRSLHERRLEIQELREAAQAARQRVEDRRRHIQELGTDEGIERAAREELHLVKPGEVVFVFEQEPAAPGEGNPRRCRKTNGCRTPPLLHRPISRWFPNPSRNPILRPKL